MRLVLILTFIGIGVICDRHPSIAPTPKPKAATVDFATTIKPALQQRCSPCHFTGGVMYARLPFDKPATITHLGTKLFGRIKDEETRAVIRAFIAQQAARPTS
jgi:hypothetical protein